MFFLEFDFDLTSSKTDWELEKILNFVNPYQIQIKMLI